MSIQIRGVIFDWAGTVVDYGCFAPVQAFIEIFEDAGIFISTEEARAPMGLHKREHIEAILNFERVQSLWKEKFKRNANDEDVSQLYQSFETKLFQSLETFTDPLPGVLQTVQILRNNNIKIGSTTGYTREMMDIVEKHASIKGYAPDCIVCADEVKKGRPAPDMILKNMGMLGLSSPKEIIKVGDTAADIKEGKNAGTWSVGIIKGSSELGLTASEVNQVNAQEYKEAAKKVTNKFQRAGADLVIDTIDELPLMIEKIEMETFGR